ncbi:hypothetical protein ACOME3_006057 [Neoechinorhynchus agilis]
MNRSKALEIHASFFIEWILISDDDENAFNIQKAMWLFGLMALLEMPIADTTFSVLRDLAKFLKNNRSEWTNEQITKSADLLICIIGRYFKQHDLADRSDEPFSFN